MSVSFGPGPTRDVQPGDTPDLNDGLLSRTVHAGAGAVVTRTRGVAYVINAGNGRVVAANNNNVQLGWAPFVAVETVTADASNSAVPVEEPISGVVAPQRVALTFEADSTNSRLELHPGDYVTAGAGNTATITPGNMRLWALGDASPKYARYLGKEAALLDINTLTPFDETLTPGVVPDQGITGLTDGETAVSWFQLVENFLL